MASHSPGFGPDAAPTPWIPWVQALWEPLFPYPWKDDIAPSIQGTLKSQWGSAQKGHCTGWLRSKPFSGIFPPFLSFPHPWEGDRRLSLFYVCQVWTWSSQTQVRERRKKNVTLTFSLTPFLFWAPECWVANRRHVTDHCPSFLSVASKFWSVGGLYWTKGSSECFLMLAPAEPSSILPRLYPRVHLFPVHLKGRLWPSQTQSDAIMLKWGKKTSQPLSNESHLA